MMTTTTTPAGTKTLPTGSPLGAAVVAGLSNDELASRLDGLFRLRAAADGSIIELLGEVDRRESFRDDGATSAEPWVAERFGVSQPTARTYVHVAQRCFDLPDLLAGLCAGELSFDKLRAVADTSTPETDHDVLERARDCSVRQLAELARSEAGASEARAAADHDRRFVRFNDRHRTVTAQLPAESYAEVRSCLEGRARKIPSDGETPWDQRLCDALLQTIRSSGGSTSASPYFVVAHVPLNALVSESGATTGLAGELESDGLISCETIRRIACDATIAIAVDDDVGHTMFEGRARRDPTDAQRREIRRRDRHCRFPGCTNATFTNAHHVTPWKRGGRTDIDNLVLLCLHHHRRVHSDGWTMSGNANGELTFVGSKGRVMTSRPSPMWTAVTGPRGAGPAGRPKGRAADGRSPSM
jgi:hypothetical protein